MIIAGLPHDRFLPDAGQPKPIYLFQTGRKSRNVGMSALPNFSMGLPMSSGPLSYGIEVTNTPDPQARDALARPLLAYNEALLGSPDIHPIALIIRSQDKGHIIGGLWGRTSFQWLFVELLFVPEALRGQSLGTELLSKAETEAQDRDCLGSWLETFSQAACRFYQRRGYQLFGAIADYPPGNTRLFNAARAIQF